MKKPNLNLKMPQLGRKPGAAQSRPGLKPPQFAADLYADLRDRRLLPLVAVLAVAIIAAPILLAGQGEEGEPTPPPAPSAGAAAQASFAVVPAETGLRDYRKRLGHREARNPFRQPPAPKPEGGGEGGTESSGGSELAATGGAETAPVSEALIPTAPAEAGSDANTETTTDVVVERQIVGYTLNIKAGFEPPLQEQKGVPPMTKLPSPDNAILSYIGLSKDNQRALFLLDSSVTAYYGPVRCTLDKETCSVVEVKPGKTAIFVYGLEETKYRLKLEQIAPVVRTREKAATVTTHEEQGKSEASK